VGFLWVVLIAGLSRYIRSEAADVLRQEHLTAARARGLPERLVLFRHVLRNACLPMITMVGLLMRGLPSRTQPPGRPAGERS
jgi:peptide/nickel transport system permease protein